MEPIIRAFELRIIINRELVRLIVGYAEGLRVRSPRKLVGLVKKHFESALGQY